MGVHRCCATEPSIKLQLKKELDEELTKMPKEETIERNAKMFGALSHPLRLKIAQFLLKRDHCVCELVDLTGEKRNLVSHHLAILRKAKVVSTYTKSNWKYYRLIENIVPILRSL